MTSPRHPMHQAVMDRLRQRFSEYRKRHYDCQNKYAQYLSAVQDSERQEASNLLKRAQERNRMMNVKGKASKQNDGKGKVEQQQQTPNGRKVCFLCCTKCERIFLCRIDINRRFDRRLL